MTYFSNDYFLNQNSLMLRPGGGGRQLRPNRPQGLQYNGRNLVWQEKVSLLRNSWESVTLMYLKNLNGSFGGLMQTLLFDSSIQENSYWQFLLALRQSGISFSYSQGGPVVAILSRFLGWLMSPSNNPKISSLQWHETVQKKILT